MSQNDEREAFEAWWKSSGQSAEPLHTLLTENAAHAAWQARAALSQRAEAPECTRSHPHENMGAFCKLRTEIARLTNENARLAANQRAEVPPAQQPQQASSDAAKPHNSPEFHRQVMEAVKAGRITFEPGWNDPPTQQPRQMVALTPEQINEMAVQEQFLLFVDGIEELTEIVKAVERAHGIAPGGKE